MSWKIVIGLLIGAGIGALMGSTRSCETGGCPLTATPLRGALYGAFIGLLFGLSLAGSAPNESDEGRPDEVLTAPEPDATISQDEAGAGEPADNTHD